MSAIRVTDRVSIPAAEIRVAFVRSGGPGGQNVNKVASKVQLRWAPAASAALTAADRAWVAGRLAAKLATDGSLIVTSDRTRDQGRNRADAEAKLAAIVRAALARPKARRATTPGRAARARRLDEKKARGRVKAERRSTGD